MSSEQLKSPISRTVETKVNALKDNKTALVAYLKATNIRYTSAPVDKSNQFWAERFATHSGLSASRVSQGQTLLIFFKETFPFDKPYSLTGTPYVTGEIIYDRQGRYLGSYITSGLTGI